MSWRDDANCLGLQTDSFFTAHEDAAAPIPLSQIRRICDACPVRTPCLEDALATDEVWYGVRAGMLPAQRRRLKAGVA